MNSEPSLELRQQGALDCYQDRCENAPFASIGGLDARSDPKPPRWVPVECWNEYWVGYQQAALELFGEDWKTCEFSWRKVLEIPSPEQDGNG